MKKFVLVALLIMAMLISACAGSTAKIATTPQAKQAEVIVKSCMAKNSLLTDPGRKGLVKCVAPPGKEKEMKQCISSAALSKHFKKKKIEEVIDCVVKFR